jgi:hypothetical protein
MGSKFVLDEDLDHDPEMEARLAKPDRLWTGSTNLTSDEFMAKLEARDQHQAARLAPLAIPEGPDEPVDEEDGDGDAEFSETELAGLERAMRRRRGGRDNDADVVNDEDGDDENDEVEDSSSQE